MMLRIALAALIVFTTSFAQADERQQTQRRVNQVQQDIAQFKKLLNQVQAQRTAEQKALKETETQIGQLEKELKTLEQQKRESEQELRKLAAEKQQLQQQQQAQQQLIAKQARAAQQAGRHEPLKLLLNQESPERVMRHLTYYQYLTQARQQQIQAFQALTQQLQEVEVGILNQSQLLAQQEQSLAEQHKKLATVRQQRQQKVAALTAEQKKHQSAITRKQRDQQELEQVLVKIEAEIARQERARLLAEQKRLEEQQRRARERLAQQAAERQEQARQQRLAQQQAAQTTQLAESPKPATVIVEPEKKHSTPPVVTAKATPPATTAPVAAAKPQSFSVPKGAPFATRRGQLPWPVQGTVAARFGSPRNDTRSKWDGLLISAQAGTPVRAVHSGRVVFADWLRGAGLLVIVDHGDGYLSLYGHNQSLMSHVGDTVQAGQTLATVGNSGGHTTSALYFAIRQQGRATDPAQWFKRQG
ncbi:murein hydrolase activator EnvC family protein [Thiopseudomonas alkaliphila]|uniref:murein hydrolase activator EnvC family protein n=1 Tax=Thiopseudomonas alkaliphila TaxID=1697053 RepID=UPI000A92A047